MRQASKRVDSSSMVLGVSGSETREHRQRHTDDRTGSSMVCVVTEVTQSCHAVCKVVIACAGGLGRQERGEGRGQ